MSRYEIPATSMKYEVVVGWDPPLKTYFAQVYDHSIQDEDDRLIVWEGGMPDSINDVERIREIVKPFTPIPHIPEHVEQRLRGEP